MNYTKTIREFCLQNKGDLFDVSYMKDRYFEMVPYKTLLKILNRLEEEKILTCVSKGVFLICRDDWSLDEAIEERYVEDGRGMFSGYSMFNDLGITDYYPGYDEIYTNRLNVRFKTIQRQMFANEDRMLTKDEYERLLDAAKDKKNEKLMLIMQTICATGIRVSELQFITVDAVNTGKAVVKLKGKIRTVFLPAQLCRQLKRYIRETGIAEGCIFINRKGNPIDRTSIWKAMKSLCKTAKVERTKVFPHNLRHLFARTYYSIQKDIVRLADILGHSSVNTTRIYTIENGNIHRMQIQELGLVRMKI